MKLADYYRLALVPGNRAVSAIRRAGLPVSRERLDRLEVEWMTQLADLKAYVEGEAAKHGMSLKYSEQDGLTPSSLVKFLYSPQGLNLEIYKYTSGGAVKQSPQPSTDDEALLPYASLANPRPDDHPVVGALLKIRSLHKELVTHLRGFKQMQRSDGCVHATYNWALRTPRISAENPQVHNIPERADKAVADGLKACIVPRLHPAPSVEDWDPRQHGSVFRWDIVGAEACIRAAMLTARFCEKPDPVAWEYLRLGKDIHSKTASLIYGVPEGTYKKGSYERDAVGKQTFFAKQYGAQWRSVQGTIWTRARLWIPDEETKKICEGFDRGYPGLVELYEQDKARLGRDPYCYDGYGRRRWVGLPDGVRFKGWLNGRTQWEVEGRTDEERNRRYSELNHRFHICANSPTQGMNATDNLFMLALCYLGEYTPLRLPPMWESRGLEFPEAKDWQMHLGSGPGGRPFLAWHNNTVHDSGWGDCGPGYLEPLAKLVWRRCRAVPFDWRIEADVPYRIELSVGPDMAHLDSYNKIAQRFGFEPVPEY